MGFNEVIKDPLKLIEHPLVLARIFVRLLVFKKAPCQVRSCCCGWKSVLHVVARIYNTTYKVYPLRSAVSKLGVDDYVGRMFSVMMRNCAVPTMLNAGYKVNVMPAQAEATISARALPGATEIQLLSEVRDVVGDDVDLTVERFEGGPEFDLPHDDPCMDAARRSIERWDPGGLLVPYLSCGGTDARHLVPLGTTVIGFTPMRPDPAGLTQQMAHGSDERISLDNLLFGTHVLLDTVLHLNDVEPLGIGGDPP